MEAFRLLIVTGMSGAGKTQVLQALEDMGYLCIDNIPPRSEERRVGKECRSRWSPYH